MNKFSIQDIIRYSAGEMEAEEKTAFEQAIENDADLKADLKLYQEVNGTLKAKFNPAVDDVAFKTTIKQLNKAYFNSGKQHKPGKIITLSKIWYAAAILILGLLVWAPWNRDLYHQYSGDIEMLSAVERGENNQQELQKATEFFNKKDFNSAKIQLKALLLKQPADDMLRFYYAISLLETNNLPLARENFTQVYHKESLFKYDAAFYTALSYLKEKDDAKAKEWLLKIPTESDSYQKAQELLAKLKE